VARLAGQGAQETGEVVGQVVKLQPHGIGGEAAAGQASPKPDHVLMSWPPVCELVAGFGSTFVVKYDIIALW
jgi:hypothetical protein